MKISTRGIYALETMVDLSMHSTEGQTESLRNIAERRNLSVKYLERIFSMMKKVGLVKSSRGANGGYSLAKKAADISIYEILKAVEGDLAPVECLRKNMDCGIACNACPTRETWYRMWVTIQDVVKSISLEELVKSSQENKKKM